MRTPKRLDTETKRAMLRDLAHSLEEAGIPETPELRTVGGLGYPILPDTTHQTVLASYRKTMGRDPIAYHAAEPNLLLLECLR